MADRVPTGLSARRRGRKFGFTVGAAFLVLAAVLLWRGRRPTVDVFTALGIILVAGGTFAPRSLLPVERVWMAVAHAISRVTTPVAMGIVFFVVLTPTAVIMRLMSRNPLRSNGDNATSWVAHDPSDMTHQF